jgi:hypothetical protein
MDLKDQQKNDYKQRLERQEERIDNTQDKALNYTTRNNSYDTTSISNGPPPPPVNYYVNLQDQQNVPRNLAILINMVKSREIVELTSVFSPKLNSWAPANTIDELKPYFEDLDNKNSVSKQCRHCGSIAIDNNSRFCPDCVYDSKS